jgi:predicted dehydrogenase
MSKVKWGVCGSGGIARRRTIPEGIVPAVNAELTGVHDVQKDLVHAVAAEFGATAFLDYGDLLASSCDVIYVATPVHLHREHVVRAAEAGKHVLCEKPLGLDVSDGEHMVEACRSNGVKFGVGLMMRFHAQHQAAMEMVKSGQLGTPVFGRAQLSCWYPPIEGAWRQDPATGGGGTLVDLANHCIDLLEMMFGPARTVRCMIGNLVQAYKSEDASVVLLEFENGAMGVVDTLFNVPDASSKNRLELYGSKGSIIAEGTIGQGEIGTMTAYIEADDSSYDAQQTRDAGAGLAIAPAPVNMYRAEIEAFSEAILKGEELPIGADAGLHSQKVIAACYESARTGVTVIV